MTVDALSAFSHVWLVDFEFSQPDGEPPVVICMVARDWRTGHVSRFWRDQLVGMKASPVPVRSDSLVVAYYASAELGCFLSLGWPIPERVLDLYAEFKCQTSGLPVPCGHGLLGALTCYGLDGIDSFEKSSMRELAMRGLPYSDSEQAALMDYCQSDVDALARLLPAMLPTIDLPRALLRGRYMAADASMQATGIPIDVCRLKALRDSWEGIKERLVQEVDREYGVYVPNNHIPRHPDAASVDQATEFLKKPSVVDSAKTRRSFSAAKFAEFLRREEVPWPRLPSGALALDADTFRQMARQHPQLAPLQELRQSLSGLRLESLSVGMDGRNRCLLSPFSSKTGRNQPSNSRYVFGPSVWLRGLIRPARGYALAYIDWCQQEFGIAAALSGDPAMMQAYFSGDPYLEFARQAGAVPPGATKDSHAKEREQFKVCALAVQYGMGARSLAESLGVCEARGRELIRLHKETYPAFWVWSQAAVDTAILRGWIETVFGWRINVGPVCNPRSLANFPMQANGAEMLRLACCLATERAIRVCGPVHDALLIEATLKQIDTVASECEAAMREASSVVLSGFELRTDCKSICWPERYMDPRGERFWDTVWSSINRTEGCCTNAHPTTEHVAPTRSDMLR